MNEYTGSMGFILIKTKIKQHLIRFSRNGCQPNQCLIIDSLKYLSSSSIQVNIFIFFLSLCLVWPVSKYSSFPWWHTPVKWDCCVTISSSVHGYTYFIGTFKKGVPFMMKHNFDSLLYSCSTLYQSACRGFSFSCYVILILYNLLHGFST